MDQIEPNIWLGNASDASNADLLRSHGVTAILNCAWDLYPKLGHHEGFHSDWVGLIDGPGNPTAIMLPAVTILAARLQGGHTVLVHCHEGKSRSPAVVAAYLAVKTSNSPFAILHRIWATRPIVKPTQAILDLMQTTVDRIGASMFFPPDVRAGHPEPEGGVA